ncbi:hypothetical protein ACTXT7_003511 [Hymenolepis weldensis]
MIGHGSTTNLTNFNNILGKLPTKPHDEFKFAILERMEKPKFEFSGRLRKELMNGVANGSQPQRRDNSELNPSQTGSDDLWSTIITPETEFDAE